MLSRGMTTDVDPKAQQALPLMDSAPAGLVVAPATTSLPDLSPCFDTDPPVGQGGVVRGAQMLSSGAAPMRAEAEAASAERQQLPTPDPDQPVVPSSGLGADLHAGGLLALPAGTGLRGISAAGASPRTTSGRCDLGEVHELPEHDLVSADAALPGLLPYRDPTDRRLDLASLEEPLLQARACHVARGT